MSAVSTVSAGAKRSRFFRLAGREWERTGAGARWYSGKRELRRSYGWPSGRQWRKLRKKIARGEA